MAALVQATSFAAELQAQMEEMAAVSVGEPEFFDLKQPWLTPQAEMDSPGLEEATFSKTWRLR
jgi:hypothetical protein